MCCYKIHSKILFRSKPAEISVETNPAYVAITLNNSVKDV